jgi:endonuclease/exonuclease/phosphatase family metal-dependent hydrolase
MPDRLGAPVITVGTFNYEHGGARPDGTFDLAPAVAHIADRLPWLDLLCLQETKGYLREGQKVLYEFAALLADRLGGTWGAHSAIDRVTGAQNAVFYRQSIFRVIRAYPDAGDLDTGPAMAGTLWLAVDGLPVPLVVKSVHWAYYSGVVRAQQASAQANLVTSASILAGDTNCVLPGGPAVAARPPWENLPPHLRGHKTGFDPATGALESDVEAGQILLRQGWVDLAALAKDGTATTNATSDRAACQIDRIAVSPYLAAGIVEGSYVVHIPDTPVSDHRLVSAQLDLAQHDQPFTAPWWQDAAFGGWRWAGGDNSHNPNTHTGWVRA